MNYCLAKIGNQIVRLRRWWRGVSDEKTEMVVKSPISKGEVLEKCILS